MIYTEAPLPSLASQLSDYMRALAARPIEVDKTAASRAKSIATYKAKGKASQKAVLKAFKKLGTANSTEVAKRTGLCSETVRKHCADLVEMGKLKIHPTRPVVWSVNV